MWKHFVLANENMASNWNTNRRVSSYAEKVEDDSERLKYYMVKNHYMDTAAITTLMNGIHSSSMSTINAAIDRAETSKMAAETLLGLLKNEKKRKEALLETSKREEHSNLKQQQKRQRLQNLTERETPHYQPWNLPTDDVDAME